jgi:hypothetical protein
MNLTNKFNLPESLVNAVRNDPYSNGGADFSVTTLLKPARMVALEREFREKLEEDASDRMWSLMGQIVHGILERADQGAITEVRYFAEIEGFKVSGQIDRFKDGKLSDYKVVTAYKFSDGGVPEDYEQQLNMNAELMRQNNLEVKSLEIVGILRDWSKLEARREPNYPQSQVIIRRVPLWPQDKALKFLKDKVILHAKAAQNLPECSESERWSRPSKFALMKKGKERAVKLYDKKEDAVNHASIDATLYVEDRPGEKIRCENYCSVSKYCSQFLNYKKKDSKDVIA